MFELFSPDWVIQLNALNQAAATNIGTRCRTGKAHEAILDQPFQGVPNDADGRPTPELRQYLEDRRSEANVTSLIPVGHVKLSVTDGPSGNVDLFVTLEGGIPTVSHIDPIAGRLATVTIAASAIEAAYFPSYSSGPTRFSQIGSSAVVTGNLRVAELLYPVFFGFGGQLVEQIRSFTLPIANSAVTAHVDLLNLS